MAGGVRIDGCCHYHRRFHLDLVPVQPHFQRERYVETHVVAQAVAVVGGDGGDGGDEVEVEGGRGEAVRRQWSLEAQASSTNQPPTSPPNHSAIATVNHSSRHTVVP